MNTRTRYLKDGDLEVWAKPLAGNEWALMLLNRSSQPRSYRYDWERYAIYDDLSQRTVDFRSQRHSYRDLWTGRSGDTAKPLDIVLPPHSVLLLRLRPAQ
jgi:alpha-galactosidase